MCAEKADTTAAETAGAKFTAKVTSAHHCRAYQAESTGASAITVAAVHRGCIITSTYMRRVLVGYFPVHLPH